MDKNTIYEKAERAINQAFEAAQKSVKVVSEKAGEAAHVTKLLIEKAAMEHRVSKKFAELGARVYEKASREGKSISLSDKDVQRLLEETKRLDLELAQVEAALEKERKVLTQAKG